MPRKKKDDFTEDTKFFPVVKLDNPSDCPVEKSLTPKVPKLRSDSDSNEFIGYRLPKGQYDINYVIKLLLAIEEKCAKGRFSAEDLRFSLQQSCRQLAAMLITERDTVAVIDPFILKHCYKCKRENLVRRSEEEDWKCDCPDKPKSKFISW